jgi:hypothetical protein
MTQLRISKVQTLPATFDPSTIYLVVDTSVTDGLAMYVSDSAGSYAKHIPTFTEYSALIDAKVAAGVAQVSTLKVVNTIAERNNLPIPATSMALVLDATGDGTVASGSASYVWTTSLGWVKIAEHESMDLSFDWSGITGRPTSTPAQLDAAVASGHSHGSSMAAIDAAVTASHGHVNKTTLDAISDTGDGMLKYNGVYIAPMYVTEQW